MAVVSLAMFEAVNAITGDYEPYLGTVAAPDDASPEAAAVAAAYRVLRTYVTAPATVAALDAARAASLAAIPDGQAKDDGIAVGEDAAAALVDAGGQRRIIAGSVLRAAAPRHRCVAGDAELPGQRGDGSARRHLVSGSAHGTVGYPEPIGLPAGASAVNRQLPLLHGSARGDERGGRGEHGAARRPNRCRAVLQRHRQHLRPALDRAAARAGPRRRPRAERSQLRTDRDGRQRRVHWLVRGKIPLSPLAAGDRDPRGRGRRRISGRRATRRSFRSSRRPASPATHRTTPAAAAPASR